MRKLIEDSMCQGSRWLLHLNKRVNLMSILWDFSMDFDRIQENLIEVQKGKK